MIPARTFWKRQTDGVSEKMAPGLGAGPVPRQCAEGLGGRGAVLWDSVRPAAYPRTFVRAQNTEQTAPSGPDCGLCPLGDRNDSG